MQEPTAFEQAMLEFINRARMNPQGEFDIFVADVNTNTATSAEIQSPITFFGTSLAVFGQQISGLSAVAPVAWNFNLAASADTHSGLMIQHDSQSHNLPNEPGLGDRISNAGYTGWTNLAENIFAYSQSPEHAHAGFFIDWGNGPNGIQDPAGHRDTIMNATYSEVGISALAENNAATQVGPFVVTQHFGRRFNYVAQLLGVVIDDVDNDDQYDIGEGMGGITVTITDGVNTYVTTTWASGGYQIEVPAGNYQVTFSGGGLVGPVTRSFTMGSSNVKLDIEADDASAVPGVTENGDGNANFIAGGVGNDTLIGNAGNDSLVGRAGNDSLEGGDGNDEIAGADGNDIINGGSGRDNIGGGEGNDTITGGEGNDVIGSGGGDDSSSGGNGHDVVGGGAGTDTVSGGAGDDTMSGSYGDDLVMGDDGNDNMGGGPGADTLNGGNGNDTIGAGFGRDTVTGDAGNDFLAGGEGNDLIDGGSGEDTINAGDGNDTITGGTEADVFVFNTFNSGESDTITDFEDGVDVLRFFAISAPAGSGLQGRFDQLGIVDSVDGAVVSYNGHSITLQGMTAAQLDLSDFLFIG